jgi:hypothetical protein
MRSALALSRFAWRLVHSSSFSAFMTCPPISTSRHQSTPTPRVLDVFDAPIHLGEYHEHLRTKTHSRRSCRTHATPVPTPLLLDGPARPTCPELAPRRRPTHTPTVHVRRPPVSAPPVEVLDGPARLRGNQVRSVKVS